MMRIFRMAAVAVLATNGAVAQTAYEAAGAYAGEYLCLGDASGGVRWDDAAGRWTGTTFNINEDRFVLKLEVLRTGQTTRFGATFPAAVYTVSIQNFGSEGFTCFSPSSAIQEVEPTEILIGSSGGFRCHQIFTEYRFNMRHLRYMETYSTGFVDGEDNGDNTPYITVGRCARL